MLVVAQEGKGRHAFIIRIFSSPDLMLAPLFKCEGEKKRESNQCRQNNLSSKGENNFNSNTNTAVAPRSS